MKRLWCSAPLVLALTASGPAMAEGMAGSGDWTGFYAGVQAGYGEMDFTGPWTFDGALYGIHAGYLHDFGQWVIGGELDYDAADMSYLTTEADRVIRAKLLAGYDLGPHLIYATVGAFDARFDAPPMLDDSGLVFGAGWKYQFHDNWTVGLEALRHMKDDFKGFIGSDFDATTVTARLSYRFGPPSSTSQAGCTEPMMV